MNKRIRLFCFPYAGASGAVYFKWKKYIDEDIEIFPVELAGRGKRYYEQLYCSFDEMILDVFDSIKSSINDCEYAFFGHSMGSWIAYDLCHKISESGYNMPLHAFFSARWAPCIKKERSSYKDMDENELLNEIIKFGGMPVELLGNKSILNRFLPVIKSDLCNIESYKYIRKQNTLDCDVSVLYGKEDCESRDEFLEWKKLTRKDFSIYEFKGGHFFINDYMGQVIEIINRSINQSYSSIKNLCK